MTCKDTFTINMRLLPVKTAYFFSMGAVACLLPFLVVYMKQLGLSPSETSIIYGTMPFIGAFVRTIAGGIADKLRRQKAVLMVSCVMAGLTHACLLFIPNVDHPDPSMILSRNVEILCEPDTSFMRYCQESELFHGEGTYSLGDNVGKPIPEEGNAFHLTSQCMMTCGLVSQHESGFHELCFNSSSSQKECHYQSTDNSSSPVQFAMEAMNKSYARYEFDPATETPRVCHYYAMNGFSHNGSNHNALSCPDPALLQCHMDCQSSKELEDSVPAYRNKFSKTFWIFFSLFLLGNIFFGPIFSLLDAIIYDFLGDKRGEWGKQRLWGTIGHALFVVTAGFVMDASSVGLKHKDYTFSFVGFLVLNIIAAISVCFFKVSSNLECHKMMKNVCILLHKPELDALLFIVFIFGMLTGIIETFLFWHLETLGASQLLMGLCMFMSCFLEIAVLFLSGKIIKLIGHVRCLYIVCIGYSIRLMSYSFLKNPWYTLAIEPLNSVTFGLMYAASSSYASLITPAGMHGTVQGLISALYLGGGKGFGSVIGGQIFEAYGAIVTFRAGAGLALVALVAYALFQLLMRFSGYSAAQEEHKEDSSEPANTEPAEEKKTMLGNGVVGGQPKEKVIPVDSVSAPNPYAVLTVPLVKKKSSIEDVSLA